MAVQIRLRRGTTQAWNASIKPLALAEVGIDITLNKIKIGNGTSLWQQLPFFGTAQASVEAANIYTDEVAALKAPIANANFTTAITTPNNTGSKISFYFANVAAFPAASDSHGAVAHSHETGKMYYAHGGSWIELANLSDITSLPGTTGPAGPQGPQGVQGVAGVEGPQGPQGLIGLTGNTGAASTVAGPAGPAGPQGAQGASINIKASVATVSALPITGNSANDARIVNADGDLYLWDGSSWSSAGQIVGPAGPQGIQGLTGLDGAKGDTGTAGTNGTNGTQGIQGIQGVEGPAGSAIPTYPAITLLNVTNNNSQSYLFNNQYSGDNPTIYAISGTTIAFELNVSGHPFLIRNSLGNYDTGLIHVSQSGTVSTGTNAQGKTSGTLYWQIPASLSGGYGYLCSFHPGMVGTITIKGIATI